MGTLANSIYLDSEFGVEQELEHAGSSLENPFVYDAAARELKALAARGLVEIVGEHTTRHADEHLIDSLRFRRIH